MSGQVSHMGDGSEQADGSGEHRKGSVCGDGAESQEVFMERGGKSLGQEPVRHRLTDVVTPPSLGPSPGPRNRCPGNVPPTGGQESDLRLLAGPRSPSEGAGEECVPGPNFGFATKTGFAK